MYKEILYFGNIFVWGLEVTLEGPNTGFWALEVSPLQLIHLEMGKADQYMDSLTYGLKLENMDQAKTNKDWTKNKKLKPCIHVPSVGQGRGYIVYNNTSLSNFLPNS